MVRTKPSVAHLALVRALKEHGRQVTTTQVERWQQQAWLPKASAWFEPASPTIPPFIMGRSLWLADNARAGRSIGWRAWVFWAIDETLDSADRLRKDLVTALRRPLTQAGIEWMIPHGNCDQAFNARTDAAAKMLPNRRAPRRDLDATLRAHAADAGLELPRLPGSALPSVSHPALMALGARLLLGGPEDVRMEDLLKALAQAVPGHPAIERLRQAHVQAGLAGTDLLAQEPLARGASCMVHTVETADDRALCHAVLICTCATDALTKLMLRAPDEPMIMDLLMADEMWLRWGHVGGITPEGKPGMAAVAINTYQYLTMPEWAAGLDRYLSFMNYLLAVLRLVPGGSGMES